MAKLRSTLICLGLGVSLFAAPALADRKEHDFDYFNAKDYAYKQQAKKHREDGFVLKRFDSAPGKKNGTLSLGGGPTPEPQFGNKTEYNFRGSNFDKPSQYENGIINLRFKF